MNAKRLLVLALMALTAISARAYDFSAVAPSGQTLYYNIVNGNAQVTSQNTQYPLYSTYPTGALTIPSSVTYQGTTYAVTSIGNSAFVDCSGLTSITIPDSVTSIGYRAFYHCSGMTSVTIPSSVTSIGQDAFEGCSGLTSVTIPEGITSIESGTFYECSGLTSVIIGSGVTSIGKWAFQYCTSLDTVYMMPPNPPSCGNYAFDDNASGRVFILCGCFYDSYSTANYFWSNHINDLREPIIDISFTVSSNDSEHGYATIIQLRNRDVRCDSTVVVEATSTSYGYHFDHWSTGSMANPDTILLSCDSAIMAFFAKNQYSVTGTTNDSIKGTVTGSATVDYLDSVTLTAIPYYGYLFVHWSDGDTANPRTVVATEDISLIAFFNENQYALVTTVNDTLRGSVISNSDVNDIDNIEYSNLSLNYFTQMTEDSVAPAGNNYFRHILMTLITNETRDCFYTFKNADGSMTWSIAPINTGIAAVYNYSFSSILYTDTTIGNTIVYSNLQGVSITYTNLGWLVEFPVEVHCTYRQSNASYTSVYWGHMRNRNGETLYTDYLSEVSIEAIPNYGYHFTHWSNGDTNNPHIFALTQDTQFVALFDKNSYTLIFLSENPEIGIVNIASASDEYLDTLQNTAVAIPHYHFTQWNDGSTDNPRRFVFDGDHTYTASFAIDVHTVGVQVDHLAHGTVSGAGSREYGQPITVSATAYSGYQFTHWSDGSTYNPYTFAVLEDKDLTAIFVADGEPWQDTVVLYDTAYVLLHDTTYLNVMVHDTTYITLTDTVTNTVYDTVTNTVYDTVDNFIYDTVTIMQYDTVTNTVYDTVDNYIYDTVTVTDTLWLTQTDTLWLHDTVTVHDTVYVTGEGIDGAEALNAKVYSSHGQVVVEGADGHAVALYDVNGRLLARKEESGERSVFDVTASGTYMIKIGHYPARKVVVVR